MVPMLSCFRAQAPRLAAKYADIYTPKYHWKQNGYFPDGSVISDEDCHLVGVAVYRSNPELRLGQGAGELPYAILAGILLHSRSSKGLFFPFTTCRSFWEGSSRLAVPVQADGAMRWASEEPVRADRQWFRTISITLDAKISSKRGAVTVERAGAAPFWGMAGPCHWPSPATETQDQGPILFIRPLPGPPVPISPSAGGHGGAIGAYRHRQPARPLPKVSTGCKRKKSPLELRE
jgi:hypothetical protein